MKPIPALLAALLAAWSAALTAGGSNYGIVPGARPHGLLVDADGMVWYTGNGNGTIGRLGPRTGKVTQYEAPSGGGPHTLVLDAQGRYWYMGSHNGRLGMIE
ncbi:MAG: hypothetical protein AB1768_09100 [Pseudomonadota bacterium]|jgi:virginiamycin B lyase